MLVVDQPKAIVRLGMTRIELQARIEATSGFLPLFLLHERHAEIAVRVDVAGFQAKGITIAGDGIGDPSLLPECDPLPGQRVDQVVPGFREVRLQAQGLLKTSPSLC